VTRWPAGDGNAIICQDNHGLRWEPAKSCVLGVSVTPPAPSSTGKAAGGAPQQSEVNLITRWMTAAGSLGVR